LVNVTR
jgi:hypothetical protein